MAENLVGDLEKAVASGGISLHYQPKVDLFQRRITGVEALARWRHPLAGNIPPDIFIPLAEAGGMIVPLGAWVLREACRQTAEWRRQGHDVTVAVNVSPLQLTKGESFDEILADALDRSGLFPMGLELEVTESVMMDGNAMAELIRLKGQGVSLAIDDFGAGYSSLAYMKQFPASTLKIDKSFITPLPSSLADCMLADSITRLAHSFGMKVVAEGVEQQEQIDVLDWMGCDLVQGYALGKPQPPGLIQFDMPLLWG